MEIACGEETAPGWARLPNHVLYPLVRRNVALLVEDLPGAAGLAVPACPEWRVRDLVAHLLDICEQGLGLLGGGPDGAVRARAPEFGGADLTALLERWFRRGAELDRRTAETGDPRADMLTHDAFSHELDLRVAVGAAPPVGHPGYTSSLDVAVGGFLARVDELGLPSPRLEAEGRAWGPADPAVVLQTGRHDLYRSLTGRRTAEQVAALSWSADPAAWLPAFTRGPFRPPERPTEDVIARR